MKKIIAVVLALLLMLSALAAAENTEGAGAEEITAPAAAEDVRQTEAVEGYMENPYLFGMKYEFDTQVDRGGFSPLEEVEGDFITVTMSVRVQRSMTPEYYRNTYAQAYNLKGNEAGIQLEITLQQAGGFSSLVLQDAVLIRVADAEGNIVDGYQMMDKEIGGHNNVEAQAEKPCVLYKRYAYNEAQPAKYLVITAYMDGKSNDIYILLENPVKYQTLEQGMISAEVRELQKKLIECGYLEGGADSAYGAMTANAVKKAQSEFGLEQTGIADDLFQRYLYD